MQLPSFWRCWSRSRQKEEAQGKEVEDKRIRKMLELMAKREEDMQRQIQLLTQLVNKKDKEDYSGTGHHDQVKVTKLGDGDDIELYISTFKRMMVAYEVPKEQWIYKLAPNLTGRALQAYTGLTIEEARDYEALKRSMSMPRPTAGVCGIFPSDPAEPSERWQ